MMSAVPGKAVEAQNVYVDTVTRPVDLYIRIRAWFVTMAYVCIHKPDFIDAQTALMASDKVLTFVTQSFKGMSAPTTFYVAAWAATVHHFSEQVRISERNLKDVIRETGTWEHRWTNWTHPSDNQGAGKDSNPDVPKHVQDEMTRMRNVISMWQKRADNTARDFNEFKKNHQQLGYGEGKPDNGKGKNYGKGSGGSKSKR